MSDMRFRAAGLIPRLGAVGLGAVCFALACGLAACAFCLAHRRFEASEIRFRAAALSVRLPPLDGAGSAVVTGARPRGGAVLPVESNNSRAEIA